MIQPLLWTGNLQVEIHCPRHILGQNYVAPHADVQHPRDIDDVAASEASEESSSDSDADEEIPIEGLPKPTVVTHHGGDTVSWDLILNFSLEALEVKYKSHAQVTWHVLSSLAKRLQRRNTVRAV